MDRQDPPRLALVLGSGGVRSVAALGIAQRLAQEGIRPGLVTGCSSGALFGATIAMGLEGTEALRLATHLWSQELTEQRRWRAYAQMILPRLAGFGDGFAMRDDGLITQRIAYAFGNTRLEQLATPLRVAATNAATGCPVVLTRGSLADALRASMAVPIIFPAVDIDGRAPGRRRAVRPAAHQAPRPTPAWCSTLGFHGADAPPRRPAVKRLVAQTSTTLINNLMQCAHCRGSARRRPAGWYDVELGAGPAHRRPVGHPRPCRTLFEAGPPRRCRPSCPGSSRRSRVASRFPRMGRRPASQCVSPPPTGGLSARHHIEQSNHANHNHDLPHHQHRQIRPQCIAAVQAHPLGHRPRCHPRTRPSTFSRRFPAGWPVACEQSPRLSSRSAERACAC
jgi:NTE family protein